MALSSNSIIHFTRTKESLMGILENNFKIHYCREKIFLPESYRELYVPMVSFCDIPLSEVKEHINKYGSYGIGLTREWAVRTGLNPVLYLEKKSVLAHNLNVSRKILVDAPDGDYKDLDEVGKCTADIFRYTKNYEADLNRGGKTIKNYRFSDEREWRYVPHFENDFEMSIGASYWDDEENKDEVENDKQKLSLLEVPFEPNDIKYIIIENDNEISDFLDFLKKAKGKQYTYHDIERLMTRLLTTEQIMSDM